MSTRTLQLWRGDASGGELVDYEVEAETGMVVLDAVLEIQRTPGAGPRRALELQGREVRLLQRRGQRPPAADVQDAARPPARRTSRSRVEPLQAFPVIRDLVTDVSLELRGQQADPAVHARARTPSG